MFTCLIPSGGTPDDPVFGCGNGLGEPLESQPADLSPSAQSAPRRVHFSPDTVGWGTKSNKSSVSASSSSTSGLLDEPQTKQCVRDPNLILHAPHASARQFVRDREQEERTAAEQAIARKCAKAKAARAAFSESRTAQLNEAEVRKAAAAARVAEIMAAKQATGKKKRGKKKR